MPPAHVASQYILTYQSLSQQDLSGLHGGKHQQQALVLVDAALSRLSEALLSEILLVNTNAGLTW